MADDLCKCICSRDFGSSVEGAPKTSQLLCLCFAMEELRNVLNWLGPYPPSWYHHTTVQKFGTGLGRDVEIDYFYTIPGFRSALKHNGGIIKVYAQMWPQGYRAIE